MIDACSYIRYYASLIPDKEQLAPILHFSRKQYPDGDGITIGLIDSAVNTQTPDLDTANFSMRSFNEYEPQNAQVTENAEHGTHSASVLIGQGKRYIRGIAPKAHLLIASVVGPNWIAEPEAIEKALQWLISENANIVVIPLGTDISYPKIERLIEKGYEKGTLIMAAAGNWHPMPLSFPACHPLTIAVGAADYFGKILPDCSRWPRLDLLAPGWRIFAPVNAKSVRCMNGTSVACVIAAGAAALVLTDQNYHGNGSHKAIIKELIGHKFATS
jgi:subtilisin family serine protease